MCYQIRHWLTPPHFHPLKRKWKMHFYPPSFPPPLPLATHIPSPPLRLSFLLHVFVCIPSIVPAECKHSVCLHLFFCSCPSFILWRVLAFMALCRLQEMGADSTPHDRGGIPLFSSFFAAACPLPEGEPGNGASFMGKLILFRRLRRKRI